MKKLILRSHQSPGDILMMTAAVRDLHAACPRQFQTDVRTSADALWTNNPYITPLTENEQGTQQLDMHYPLIHQSNQRPYHFIHGYAQHLEQQLNVRIPVTKFQGDVHLSNDEKQFPPAGLDAKLPEHFWIIVAGGKFDFTAKWWNPANYQKVVDHFLGRVQFVQCGEQGHWHPKLSGVVDLVGKTDLRKFLRLMYHADGVLCPVTFAMHLAAAVETKPGRPRRRPCVVIAGGREPPHWEAYPHHQFLSTVGALSCCVDGGCWRSRCQLVGDGDDKDRRNICEQPVQIAPDLRIPRCMEMITAEDAIRRIEIYLQGATYSQEPHATDRRRQGHPTNAVVPPKGQAVPPAIVSNPATNILIRFRHGLGDAVQLTTVLQHLRHYHPDWQVDVAALVGKHSAFHGLCRNVYVLDRDRVPRDYGRTFDLDWHEPNNCYADSPSSKAERCLREVFQQTPLPNFCRYRIQQGEKARALARAYLEQICGDHPRDGARFPVVLIHYEGNNSADKKNVPASIVQDLCEFAIQSGYVPVILDWDRRSKLPDGKRIHNPAPRIPLWGPNGTGDAEALAALIDLSSLMIGVDSGPLHVAGATSTPTIGVWTGHHPLHYFGHAENVLHLVPENHLRLLRGDPAVGERYFCEHYQFRTYADLGNALRALMQERLSVAARRPIRERDFWIPDNHVEQDRRLVQEITDQDAYHVDELPVHRPVVVDIGAHVGCFARRVHQRNPLARIIAVEHRHENIPPLRKNAGAFAVVVHGVVTYEKEVALNNNSANSPPIATLTLEDEHSPERTMPPCKTEGAPAINGQTHKEIVTSVDAVQALTLEQLMRQHAIDQIDVLKLEYDGGQDSILRRANMLDRVEMIVGDYHGKKQFHDLVRERFADWQLRIVKDGENGVFWLRNPRRRSIFLA